MAAFNLVFDSNVRKPHCCEDKTGLMVYKVPSSACSLLMSKAHRLQLAGKKKYAEVFLRFSIVLNAPGSFQTVARSPGTGQDLANEGT